MARLPTLAGALTAAALAASLSAGGSAAHASDPDVTPPTLTLEPLARLIVDSEVSAYDAAEFYYWLGRFRLHWQADDPSGICEQEVAWSGYDRWYEEDPVLGVADHFAVDPDARTFDLTWDALDDGRGSARFVVRVTDCAGNTATSEIAGLEFPVVEDYDPAVAYLGPWQEVTDADRTSLHTTDAPGASASTSFKGGRPIALVMQKGPERGRAEIRVDGELVDVVDTASPTVTDQVVVWEGWYPAGEHELTVVNEATAGRPEIAFDLVVGRRAGDPVPPVLEAIGEPVIEGTRSAPVVGDTLRAVPPTWSVPPTSVTYQWLQHGRPISGATGATLRLTPRNAGKRISVRVGAVRGTETAEALSDPTDRVRARSQLARAHGAGYRGRADLTVTLTTPGVTRPDGILRIRLGDVTLRKVAVRRSPGTVHWTYRGPRGWKTFTVTYSGSDRASRATKSFRVLVR